MRRRRSFLKVHVAFDVRKKQIVVMEVTDERTGDGVTLRSLLMQAENRCRLINAICAGTYARESNINEDFKTR